MPNVIEILVIAKDSTKAAFKETEGGLGSLMKVAGEAGLAVGGALIGIGVEAVKMASQFDAEMTKLVTQAGVSQSKLAGLKQGVLDLAGKVGFDPTSLAEALYHVESNFASLGITSQKAMELLKVAAEGARVGGANLVDVTNALTAAVASGIPGVEDFSKAMGVLNATVGAGDMTMQDLANAMGTGFVAVVKQYGLSIKDVGAALAVFGDNNIRGAKAGTQLRMAVQALAVPAKSAGTWLDKMHMTVDQLSKDMQSGGLMKALMDLRTHMTAIGITAKEQGQVLTDMFGKKAGVGIAVLFDQLDRLKSKYPELTKSANGFADAWTQTKGTLKQQFADIRAAWDALLIRFGEGATPYLAKVIGDVEASMGRIKAIFAGSNLSADFSQAFSKVGPDALKNFERALRSIEQAIKDNKPQLEELGRFAAMALGLIIKYGPLALEQLGTVIREIGSVMRMFNLLASFAIEAFRTILDGAVMAMGWIPGIGPKLKKARDEFDKFAQQVNDALNGIHDKNVNVNLRVTQQIIGGYNSSGTNVGGQGGSRGAGLAHGGIAGAAMGRIGAGLTWVGEHGAELLQLPAGARVFSNPDSRRMAAAGGGGAVSVVLQVAGNADNELARFVHWLVRTKKIQLKVANNGYVVPA